MNICLSPEQEAHLTELASSAGRSASEIVVEALALWQSQQSQNELKPPSHTPAEAAARILELRKGNVLPEGESIKDLLNYGRA